MCRNIRELHNFAPPATDDEVRAAALQYVRKVSGSTKPSKANEAAFERAVDRIAEVTRDLLGELVTQAPPKDREVEAAKRRARSEKRFARLAPDPADQPLALRGQIAEPPAHVGEPGAELGIADLDGRHRVLEVGEDLLGVGRVVDRLLDELADAVRRRQRGGGELARRQAGA